MEFEVNFEFTYINKPRVVHFFPSFNCVCERSVKRCIIYELLQILDFCMTSSPHKCLGGERRIAGVSHFPVLQLHSHTLVIWGTVWQPLAVPRFLPSELAGSTQREISWMCAQFTINKIFVLKHKPKRK